MLSCVQLFATPWSVACQAPLSMEFSRQEYCSGLPCPSPRDFSNPGIKPASPPLAGGFFTTEPPASPVYIHTYIHIYFYFIVSCTLYSYYINIYDIKCYSPKSFSDIQQNFVQILYCCNSSKGFPGGSYSKESACNMGHLGSIPGLGKFPWMRAWQPTPVFLPGEFPWTEEPGGLQSMGLQRVRHDWVTKHSTAQF